MNEQIVMRELRARKTDLQTFCAVHAVTESAVRAYLRGVGQLPSPVVEALAETLGLSTRGLSGVLAA